MGSLASKASAGILLEITGTCRRGLSDHTDVDRRGAPNFLKLSIID